MPRRVVFARQPRIAGIRRVNLGGGFHPDVEEVIVSLQKRYCVSRAWVIAFYCEIGMFGKASAEHVEDFTGAAERPQLRRVK